MELTEKADSLVAQEFRKKRKTLKSLLKEEAIKEMLKISNQIYQKVFEETDK